MKLTFKKALIAGLASLLCSVSLISCGGVNLRPGAEGLYDKDNQVSYSHASPVYEATSLLNEYGKLTVTDKESYALYTIPGTEPTKMLATEDFNIIYSSDMTLPTLTEMAPTVLRICSDSIELKRIEDKALVAKVAKAYADGNSLEYPGTTPQKSYKARFESVDYPGFYYTLTYLEYSSDLVVDGQNYGRYFLYNSFDKVFVAIGSDIHDAMDDTPQS